MPEEIKAVIVSQKCPYCQRLQTHLKEKGLTDKVKIIDVGTEEGRKFANENNINAVPECVVILEKDGKKENRVCTDEEFEKLVKEGQ